VPYGLYLSAEGAYAQSQRLNVVANNMANVETTAFKRDVAVFQARFTEATQRGLDQPGSRSLNDLCGGVMLEGTVTDLSQGTLRNTGRPTDLAIEGDGYFVVHNGKENYLTRAGNFLLNAQGGLVTQKGDLVLSDVGNPVLVDPEAGPWVITPDGVLQQDGVNTPLAMLRPKHPSDLVKIGDNLFMPLAKTPPVPLGERRVVVGCLEGSGVKPTLEMMEMIEASRAFEANTNMIRNQDQMLGTLISRVLKEG